MTLSLLLEQPELLDISPPPPPPHHSHQHHHHQQDCLNHRPPPSSEPPSPSSSTPLLTHHQPPNPSCSHPPSPHCSGSPASHSSFLSFLPGLPLYGKVAAGATRHGSLLVGLCVVLCCLLIFTLPSLTTSLRGVSKSGGQPHAVTLAGQPSHAASVLLPTCPSPTLRNATNTTHRYMPAPPPPPPPSPPPPQSTDQQTSAPAVLSSWSSSLLVDSTASSSGAGSTSSVKHEFRTQSTDNATSPATSPQPSSSPSSSSSSSSMPAALPASSTDSTAATISSESESYPSCVCPTHTFLISFPRSGNTFTRRLLEQLTGTLTGSVYGDMLLYRGGLKGERSQRDVLLLKHHFIDWTTRDLDLERMLYHNLSAECNGLGPDSLYVIERYLYVVRNPFDVLVSWFHFLSLGTHDGVSAELSMAGLLELADVWLPVWAKHVRTFTSTFLLEGCVGCEMMLIKYEELLAPPPPAALLSPQHNQPPPPPLLHSQLLAFLHYPPTRNCTTPPHNTTTTGTTTYAIKTRRSLLDPSRIVPRNLSYSDEVMRSLNCSRLEWVERVAGLEMAAMGYWPDWVGKRDGHGKRWCDGVDAGRGGSDEDEGGDEDSFE